MARIEMSEADYQAYLQHKLTRDGGASASPVYDLEMKYRSRSAKERQRKGPNKTERRFAREMLDVWIHEGYFVGYMWEPYRLSVILDNGNVTTYRPDFLAWDHDGRVTMFEVKGARVWDDAKIKFLMARQKFPFWKWEAWQWKGGEWNEIWRDINKCLTQSC